MNPNKIQYALEIKPEALENQLVKYNWHKIITHNKDEEKEDIPEDNNEESVYDVNAIFKDLTHSLPKKKRYKATKLYQKTA